MTTHSFRRRAVLIGSKDKLKCKRLYSNPKDKATGVMADHVITLMAQKLKKGYPDRIHQVSIVDKERNRRLDFLANDSKFQPKP